MQSTWKVKNIKTITVISLIALFILALFVGLNNAKNIELEKIKKELLEAKKPSKIELQKKELEDLEISWRKAEEFCQKKPKIEEKIHNKRNEILGLKKLER